MSASNYRFLVVDDNKDAANALAMVLKFMGHTTRTAHDGLEALQVAEDFVPDVALVDIGLPKLDGYEVCRRIRAEDWGNRIILIALTGWGEDEEKMKASEAGFHFHLVKPVEPAALGKLLGGKPSASA